MTKDKYQIPFYFICCVLLFVIIYFSFFTLNTDKQSSENICVPKISGQYTPLDFSNYSVVVLNLNDKYHLQLSKEIALAIAKIKELKQEW